MIKLYDTNKTQVQINRKEQNTHTSFYELQPASAYAHTLA